MKDSLYKPQQLWNIALFQLREDERLMDVASRRPDKIFSPQRLLRTHYHQITGYADPFLFVDGEYLYLFYEEEHLFAPAPICAVRTKDLVHWENIGVVLKEPYHLSYPNVFAYDGQIYMIPETRECEAVILYRAVDFPYKWERYKVLLADDKYVDSSLFHFHNKWFLFTTAWYEDFGELRVYMADDLLGPYQLHPMSPVAKKMSDCRCGGAIIENDGRLFRPTQFCANYYGEELHLYEIDFLSETEYSEHFVKSMTDKVNSWSTFGGHHLNTVIFRGKRIVVMDGIVNDNWINNHTRKLFNYCHRHILK